MTKLVLPIQAQRIAYYFSGSTEQDREIIAKYSTVLELLAGIPSLVETLVENRRVIAGEVSAGAWVDDGPVFIDATATVEHGAFVGTPAYIGPGVTVRQGAYLRGQVILLHGSVLGHASEAKNSLFFSGAQAPHFAYVGDSVLGSHSNLGAGTKLSNLPVNSTKHPQSGERSHVRFRHNGDQFDTGLSKFGAIVGDRVQIGCNSVTSPGTFIGMGTMVYPMANVRSGLYGPNSLIRSSFADSQLLASPSLDTHG